MQREKIIALKNRIKEAEEETKEKLTWWVGLNSKFGLLVVGFILTTVVGSFLASQIKKDQ